MAIEVIISLSSVLRRCNYKCFSKAEGQEITLCILRKYNTDTVRLNTVDNL